MDGSERGDLPCQHRAKTHISSQNREALEVSFGAGLEAILSKFLQRLRLNRLFPHVGHFFLGCLISGLFNYIPIETLGRVESLIFVRMLNIFVMASLSFFSRTSFNTALC